MKIQHTSRADRIIDQGRGCIFDPSIHHKYDSCFIRGLREITGKKNLHTYYHTETFRHMLFEWLVHPGDGHPTGVMLELEGWYGDNYPTYEFLKARLAPVNPFATAAIARMKEKAGEAREETQIRFDKQKSLTSYAKRHGLEDTARRLKNGEFPLATRIK